MVFQIDAGAITQHFIGKAAGLVPLGIVILLLHELKVLDKMMNWFAGMFSFDK